MPDELPNAYLPPTVQILIGARADSSAVFVFRRILLERKCSSQSYGQPLTEMYERPLPVSVPASRSVTVAPAAGASAPA